MFPKKCKYKKGEEVVKWDNLSEKLFVRERFIESYYYPGFESYENYYVLSNNICANEEDITYYSKRIADLDTRLRKLETRQDKKK